LSRKAKTCLTVRIIIRTETKVGFIDPKNLNGKFFA